MQTLTGRLGFAAMSLFALAALLIASTGKPRICGGTLVDADNFAQAKSTVQDYGFTRREVEVIFRCSNDRSACVVVDGICGERVWVRREYRKEATDRFARANATIDCAHPTSALPILRVCD
jgi:hypothetical protein